jgi:hypothetical protein
MLFGEAVILLAIVPLAERKIVARIAAEQRVLDGEVALGRHAAEAAGHLGACGRGRVLAPTHAGEFA